MTTQPAITADRPSDLVARDFTATGSNQLWVADLTYVATWRGLVYVAFVIDVSCRVAGIDLAPDRLRTGRAGTAHLRPPGRTLAGLVHHSDRGTQYLSIRYSDRLADLGIAPSVGRRGESYDNAFALTAGGPCRCQTCESGENLTDQSGAPSFSESGSSPTSPRTSAPLSRT